MFQSRWFTGTITVASIFLLCFNLIFLPGAWLLMQADPDIIHPRPDLWIIVGKSLTMGLLLWAVSGTACLATITFMGGDPRDIGRLAIGWAVTAVLIANLLYAGVFQALSFLAS